MRNAFKQHTVVAKGNCSRKVPNFHKEGTATRASFPKMLLLRPHGMHALKFTPRIMCLSRDLASFSFKMLLPGLASPILPLQ